MIVSLDPHTKKSIRKAIESLYLFAAILWLETRLRLSLKFGSRTCDDFQEEANVLLDRYEALYGHAVEI